MKPWLSSLLLALLASAHAAPARSLHLTFHATAVCPEAILAVSTRAGGIWVHRAQVLLGRETYLTLPAAQHLTLAVQCARGRTALGGQTLRWSGAWPRTVLVRGPRPGVLAWPVTPGAWGRAPLLASR